MPTKSNPFEERAPAIKACAECFQILKGIEDDTLLPTKMYNRRAESHRAKWLELTNIAEAQAQRASAPTVKRAPRKARTSPSDVSDANTSVPITQAASA